MSRQFSIPTVLRMVPNYLLRPFFKNLGHGPCEIDFDHLSEREVEPMVAAIVDLPRPDQDFFEGVLRSIFDLGCEAGMQSLLEAAEKCGQYDFAAQLPEDGSCYEKAMWAWLYHKEVFDKALQFHQVAHLSWWRKRCDLPQRTPDLSPATLQQLAEDLASFLTQAQGRGQICTVEALDWGNGQYYFFAYWLPTTLTNNEAYCTEQSAQWGGTVYCSNGGLYIIWLYPVVYCADGVLYFAPSSTDYPSNLRLVDGIITGTASWEMLPGCIATIRFNGG